VQYLRKQNIPLILLGGGGYTVKNVARVWTYETACALGIEDTIDHNLPWNEYFEWFGPRYRLEVAENNMDDLNVKDGSLDKVRWVGGECLAALVTLIMLPTRENALQQISELTGAPSVGMHDVPRESVGEHLGFGKDEEEGRDELDERLAREPHSILAAHSSNPITRIEHARYVYNLEESESISEELEDGESSRWDSDDSSSTRRNGTRRRYNERASKKVMSIITNQYFDAPGQDSVCAQYEFGPVSGKTGKRRFFQSGARWDEAYERVFQGRGELMKVPGSMTLSALMENGGVDANVDEDWDDSVKLDS
jgi:histone deacetylase 1/2